MFSNKLCDPEFCGTCDNATMSGTQFDFLVQCLRFYVNETKQQKSKEERVAPVRDIWEMFISSCKNNYYNPESYLTLDEQLVKITL